MHILIDPARYHTPTGIGIGVFEGCIWSLSPCCTVFVRYTGTVEEGSYVWECSTCKEIVSLPTGIRASAIALSLGSYDGMTIEQWVRAWTGIPELEVTIGGDSY